MYTYELETHIPQNKHATMNLEFEWGLLRPIGKY